MDPGRIFASAGEIADFVVEGWSFGHSIAESTQDIDTTAGKLVENCESLCRSGGVIVLIETLGSNSDAPNPPGEKLRRFYEALETKHGFSKTVIATDYKFSSVGEAHRIFTYFFGEETGRSIKEKGSPTVPEFTGIWHKTVI